MQTSKTIEPAAEARAPAAQGARDFMRRAFGGPRGLIILGIAVVAGGLALGWGWLTAVGLAPIILALAPCAAMCALGMCAMSRGGSGGPAPTTTEKVGPAPSSTDQ